MTELEDNEWEQICFNMSAVDTFNQETMGEATICEFTPEFSPFGNACSVSSSPTDGGAWILGVVVALVFLRIRASSRRSHRRSA
jgi:MYXO-CTERM domain-containing protein